MRVIGGLRFDVALGPPWLGAADRGHARGRRCDRGCECRSRRLWLRAGIAAAAAPGMARFGMPRFAVGGLVGSLGVFRLGVSRLRVPRLVMPWLAFTSPLAAAGRT